MSGTANLGSTTHAQEEGLVRNSIPAAAPVCVMPKQKEDRLYARREKTALKILACGLMWRKKYRSRGDGHQGALKRESKMQAERNRLRYREAICTWASSRKSARRQNEFRKSARAMVSIIENIGVTARLGTLRGEIVRTTL